MFHCRNLISSLIILHNSRLHHAAAYANLQPKSSFFSRTVPSSPTTIVSQTSLTASSALHFRRSESNPRHIYNMSSGLNDVSAESNQQLFGRFKIASSQIFYRSTHSFGMVNLRPLVPGHVLVVSNRVAPLLSDLDEEEYDDLWKTTRKVQDLLKQQYKCEAFNVAVQDGAGAGQSVPHVHVHVLPRCQGDLERNDEIYDMLELWAPRDELAANKPRLEVPEDIDRRDRTIDEMAEEASIYRALAYKV
ncbi:hypothetical protein ACHAXS_006591 [Conticribra weissflogii]